MKRRPFVAAGVILLTLLLPGCASRASRPIYSPSSVGNPVTLPSAEQHGRVIAVRDVTIKDGGIYTASGPGRVPGALATTARVMSGSIYAIMGVIGDAIENAKPE